MIWARRLKLLTKFGVAALALGALATSGKAQNAYQGKFTLPFETHWGGATLPAGDYTFALPSNSAPYRFYIQGQGTSAIIHANTVEKKVVSKRPQLNIVDITDVHTVQTFEASELGVTFTYSTPKQKHAEHQEARQKTVPQTAPASQVSENKTSIAVHTAGR
jgi:CRISPR/Cas system-associated protein Cas5 (RAMP superfamily)